jgi:hypothetical protein
MNPRSAAAIALGVAGIWLIVSRIPEIALTLVFSPAEPDGILRWLGPIQFGVVAGCGLALVLLRHRLASWLVPTAQPDLTGSAPELQAAAFSVVGLLLLARGFADGVAQLAMSVANAERASFAQLASPLVQIAVGLALFIGARNLVTVWQSLRTAGQSRSGGDGGGGN